MAPDFESFIRFGEDKIYSHRWLGALWFDLPLGLAVTFIFHIIVRDSLIVNLPRRMRQKFEFGRKFNWLAYFESHFLIVITSLLIGIFSHLLWDAFTHLNLSFPDSQRSRIMLGNHRIYILLQYITSLIGLIIVSVYCYRLPATKVILIKRDIIKYWVYVLLITGVIGSYVLVRDINALEEIDYLFVINVCIASFLSGLIVVSLFDKVANRKHILY